MTIQTPILILGNRALIEMDGANLTKLGGIILPESDSKASKSFAKIMALGDGDKVGQKLKDAFANESRILINGVMLGLSVELGGKKYRMISTEDILAVLS